MVQTTSRTREDFVGRAAQCVVGCLAAPGFYPLDARSSCPPSSNNPKYVQTLPFVPCGTQSSGGEPQLWSWKYHHLREGEKKAEKDEFKRWDRNRRKRFCRSQVKVFQRTHWKAGDAREPAQAMENRPQAVCPQWLWLDQGRGQSCPSPLFRGAQLLRRVLG